MKTNTRAKTRQDTRALAAVPKEYLPGSFKAKAPGTLCDTPMR